MVKGKKMEANTSRRFPEFFKVYISQHSSKRMCIPPAFVRHLTGVIPEKTILRSGMGKQWHVEVGKTDNAVFFQNGWQRFVEENSIEEGEFLVFRFNGDFFDYKIFGHSLCEKGTPSIKEEEDSQGEDDPIDEEVMVMEGKGEDDYDHDREEVSVKDEDEGEDDFDHDVEEVGAMDVDEGEDDYDHDGEEVRVKDEDEGEDDEDEDDSDAAQDHDNNYYGEGEDDRDHDDGHDNTDDDDGQFKKPYFIARRNQEKRDKVPVPAEVIKDNNLVLHSDMEFLDPSGRKWDGKVSIWKDGRTWIGGWGKFCRQNNVGKRDKCICEFLLDRRHKCTGSKCYHSCNTLKVDIIRADAPN